jgi:hypothetical protein
LLTCDRESGRTGRAAVNVVETALGESVVEPGNRVGVDLGHAPMTEQRQVDEIQVRAVLRPGASCQLAAFGPPPLRLHVLEFDVAVGDRLAVACLAAKLAILADGVAFRGRFDRDALSPVRLEAVGQAAMPCPVIRVAV